MRLVDARRLTGPNHLAPVPLVIAELALDPDESIEAAASAYLAELARMRAAVGLAPEVSLVTRPHTGGVVFGYEAPLDVMLACAEMSEWAAESACDVLASAPPRKLDPKRAEVEAFLARDRNPRLLALAAEARAKGLPLLWDDDEVSLGAGRRSVTYPLHALPEVAAVDWSSLGTIPTVLVTGTNGKTTSSRLLARVATEAGRCVGTTSTGGITIGSAVLEDGDWTGPAAARIVLRHPEVQLAVLETARGGILRRGLAIDTCDAALVTNVSDDHIGLYGIDDVNAMAEVKGVVAKAVRAGGTAALNASDPRLVSLGLGLACEVTFFADLEVAPPGAAARAVIAAHRARGGRVVVTEGGAIIAAKGETERTIVRVDTVPVTFGGAARYNVQNVLGVVSVAEALGIADAAIVRGLQGFAMRDNPGRGQVAVSGGVTIFLDFGHNPEGVRAVMQLVTTLRAEAEARTGRKGKLTIVTGSPGDRSDQEITDVACILHEASPDQVFVRELGDYLRGRAPGDVPALYRATLLARGFPAQAFSVVDSEVEALRRSLDRASPGDFIAVLVHLDEADVQAFLAARAAEPANTTPALTAPTRT
jgi:UDP-N-acetylmuramyl tripeptide synthase